MLSALYLFSLDSQQPAILLVQEYVAVNQENILPMPDTISDEHAAQFIVNPWTAVGLLKFLNVPRGEWLIQTRASSVLGRQIISLAKHYGIKVRPGEVDLGFRQMPSMLRGKAVRRVLGAERKSLAISWGDWIIGLCEETCPALEACLSAVFPPLMYGPTEVVGMPN
jgi:hypothetical protein